MLGGSSVGARVREVSGARSTFCNANEPTTEAHANEPKAASLRGTSYDTSQSLCPIVAVRLRKRHRTSAGVQGPAVVRQYRECTVRGPACDYHLRHYRDCPSMDLPIRYRIGTKSLMQKLMRNTESLTRLRNVCAVR